jgi:hypothetical protein
MSWEESQQSKSPRRSLGEVVMDIHAFDFEPSQTRLSMMVSLARRTRVTAA